MKAKSTYAVKKWEESPYEQISTENKMTRATVEYSIQGEINGEAMVEYLMFYRHFDEKDQHNSSAVYVGLIRFVGKVGGSDGSFVLEDRGTFENGEASSTLKIIAGSGTGELKSIQGTGRYSAAKDGAQIELEYDL